MLLNYQSNKGNLFMNEIPNTEPAHMIWHKTQEVELLTMEIFKQGMTWNDVQWSMTKEYFDDYRDACMQVSSGAMSEILLHGVGSDGYVTLNAENVQSFFNAGLAFKITTLLDEYKIKDLGGTLSNGKTVKALKDMTLEELNEWKDPRLKEDIQNG